MKTNPGKRESGSFVTLIKAKQKDFKESGLYATGVHINNNVYSVFNNKVSLKGVNEFMNHFVAIPSGWWFKNK